MQIGFIGLGAVVETAYLPALRRLGDVIDRCQGYDLDCSRALPGSSAVVRCRRCWPNPWIRSSLPPYHFSICPYWRGR